jgi:hypothetical protein
LKRCQSRGDLRGSNQDVRNSHTNLYLRTTTINQSPHRTFHGYASIQRRCNMIGGSKTPIFHPSPLSPISLIPDYLHLLHPRRPGVFTKAPKQPIRTDSTRSIPRSVSLPDSSSELLEPILERGIVRLHEHFATEGEYTRHDTRSEPSR